MAAYSPAASCLASLVRRLHRNPKPLYQFLTLSSFTEGGYFTGIIYHWSFWYTPRELVPRVLALYMANSLSGAVSGFLAWAISYADQHLGLSGWQW